MKVFIPSNKHDKHTLFFKDLVISLNILNSTSWKFEKKLKKISEEKEIKLINNNNFKNNSDDIFIMGDKCQDYSYSISELSIFEKKEEKIDLKNNDLFEIYYDKFN